MNFLKFMRQAITILKLLLQVAVSVVVAVENNPA